MVPQLWVACPVTSSDGTCALASHIQQERRKGARRPEAKINPSNGRTPTRPKRSTAPTLAVRPRGKHIARNSRRLSQTNPNGISLLGRKRRGRVYDIQYLGRPSGIQQQSIQKGVRSSDAQSLGREEHKPTQYKVKQKGAVQTAKRSLWGWGEGHERNHMRSDS